MTNFVSNNIQKFDSAFKFQSVGKIAITLSVSPNLRLPYAQRLNVKGDTTCAFSPTIVTLIYNFNMETEFVSTKKNQT